MKPKRKPIKVYRRNVMTIVRVYDDGHVTIEIEGSSSHKIYIEAIAWAESEKEGE